MSAITFGQLQAAAGEVMLAPALMSPEEQRAVAATKARADAQQPVQPFQADQVLGILQRMRGQLPAIVKDLSIAENEKIMSPAEYQHVTALHGKFERKEPVTVGDGREALKIFQAVRTMVSQATSRFAELQENMAAIFSGPDQDALLTIGTKLDFGSPMTAGDAATINRIYREFKNNWGGYDIL